MFPSVLMRLGLRGPFLRTPGSSSVPMTTLFTGLWGSLLHGGQSLCVLRVLRDQTLLNSGSLQSILVFCFSTFHQPVWGVRILTMFCDHLQFIVLPFAIYHLSVDIL